MDISIKIMLSGFIVLMLSITFAKIIPDDYASIPKMTVLCIWGACLFGSLLAFIGGAFMWIWV